MNSKNRFYVIRAWCVHLYTSLGLVLAFFTFLAIWNRNPILVLWLNGAALFIDATDGTLARRWGVKKWAPTFDGRKLDDITDYINYTFIPIFFAYQFGLVQESWMWVLALALLTGAYGFCQDTAKTNDGFFTGFPNYWNLLVFYLFVFNANPVVNALLLLAFSILIFVPVKYVSYSTKSFQKLTVLVSAVYGLLLGYIVYTFDHLNMGLVWLSILGPLYSIGISLYLQFGKGRIRNK